MNDLRIPRKLNFLVFTLAVFAVLFVFSKPAMAQATTGILKGAVVDPQGAAIAGATVTVTNEATGIVQTTTATSDGLFAITNLPPGKYTVTAWHKTGGTFHKTIEVTNGPVPEVNFFVPLPTLPTEDAVNHAGH